MCDYCFAIVDDKEQIYGIKLGEKPNVKVFVGHESCISIVHNNLKEIYQEAYRIHEEKKEPNEET